jgi:hypothetical protein
VGKMWHRTVEFGDLDISSLVGNQEMKCTWYNVQLMIAEGGGHVYTLVGRVYDGVGSTLSSAGHKKVWLSFRPADFPDHSYYVVMQRMVDGWEHDDPWTER